MTTWTTWRTATERALYGIDGIDGIGGFFRRPGASPAAHFRTSVHASAVLARVIAGLARTTALGTVIDVGAGGGELLIQLHQSHPGLRLIGVDLADRPAGLPAGIAWTDTTPTGLDDALVIANEWLDNVPVEVVELTGEGWRLVLVDPATGDERLGPPPDDADQSWLGRWWPAGGIGDRAEVGRPRDEAWAGVVAGLTRGLAIAVDYAHSRDARPPVGSLTGHRSGRRVPPVPDGSCDITSHVALDSCAAAGAAAGATATVRTTQRDALAALGVRAEAPDHTLARSDPAAYVRALADAGEVAELTDPRGLGGFGWLVQAVGMPLPHPLSGTDS